MASYNLTKREDRDRLLQDRQAELEAIEQDRWPRDLNDQMRWNPPPGRTATEHARLMCQADIAAMRQRP